MQGVDFMCKAQISTRHQCTCLFAIDMLLSGGA